MLAVSLLMPAGCGRSAQPVWTGVPEDGVVRIAMVGDGAFCRLGGTMEAFELAAADAKAQTGLELQLSVFDDEADYNKAIARVREIADDPTIAAVIVKQELDYIDAAADMLDQAQKPFFITNGCYEHTIDAGYEYMLVDCISAAQVGTVMSRHILDRGYRRVAFCHSPTEYEEDELKGMYAALAGSDATLVDACVSLNSPEELRVALRRWEALGVDVVCVNDYTRPNSELVRMLRQEGSALPVLSDYDMDTDDELARNGAFLDGTSIVPLYGLAATAQKPDVLERFSQRYGMEMSEHAVQTYDLVTMLAQQLARRPARPDQLVAALREGRHAGIYGDISFDARGVLDSSGTDPLVFQDGRFRPQAEEEG